MLAAAGTKATRSEAGIGTARSSPSAPGSTTIRTLSIPSTSASASMTWASNGRPPIGTRHLWLTPASAASGSSRPSRWAARTIIVKPRSVIEQPVPAQALVENGLDQLGLGQAGADRRAAEHLLRPEIGLEVELEEVERSGLRIEPELEAAVIEGAEFLGDAPRIFRDLRHPALVVERHQLVFVRPLDQVALLVISAQVRRIGLLEQHHRHHHRRAVDGDHRHLDIASVEEGLDDRVVALGMDVGDRRLDPGPVARVLNAPAGRGGVGLDHHTLADRAARLADRRSAAVDRPGRGRNAARG